MLIKLSCFLIFKKNRIVMLVAKVVSAREWFGLAVVEYRLSLDGYGIVFVVSLLSIVTSISLHSCPPSRSYRLSSHRYCQLSHRYCRLDIGAWCDL